MVGASTLSTWRITIFADLGGTCAVSSDGRRVPNKHLKGLIWKLYGDAEVTGGFPSKYKGGCAVEQKK